MNPCPTHTRASTANAATPVIPRFAGALVAAAIALPFLAACGGASSSGGTSVDLPTSKPDASAFPVAIKDCDGSQIRIAKPPRRIVAQDGYAAVTLEQLGVADRIVGVGLPEAFSTTTGPERSVLDSLPVLADRIPPTEVVANARPDLLVTAFSALGNAEGSPTKDKLTHMGAAGLSACMPGGVSYKASTSSNDSVIDDFKPTYDFIERVGRAVGANAAAKKVVASLEARVATARPADGGDRPRVLILTDDPAAGQPLPVSGGASIANAVVEQAGGVNLFKDLGGMHAVVSPEEVVHRDPQIILVVTGYRSAKVPGDKLLAAVKSNALLRTTAAVRHGQVLAVSQNQVAFPSPLNVDALERLAPVVAKARLADKNGS